jgi:hypothetical protein
MFSELDFIDLIIDNNPLLLIVWKIRWATKVKIIPVNENFKNKGSFILKIPPDTEFIQIVATNLWRKNTRRIQLKHTQLNDAAGAFLIKQFQPFTTLDIKKSIITLQHIKCECKKSIIHIKTFKVYPTVKLRIETEKFKYT